jgi:carbon-monoxide dehydrogenase medium subunit
VQRRIPEKEFFTGPGKIALQRGEWVVAVELVPTRALEAGAYLKLGLRRAMEIATVSVAALVELERVGSEVCLETRIALGAVASTPIRAKEAERLLAGKELNEANIRQVARAAARDCQPITDHRASAEYRRAIVEVLVRRAVSVAGERATHRSHEAKPGSVR